ncbi:MAG: 5-oxoprolinase subunit PxpB [Verrucomicrobia bacterium]|nr:5-oxoprolinase subunit PxpB [Verrucomicrobiota bacterium]
MPLQWSQCGPLALRVQFASQVNEEAFRTGLALLHWLESRVNSADAEWVPAFTTLLVIPATAMVRDRILSLLPEVPWPLAAPEGTEAQGRRVEIPVVYGGPDLARVAVHAGISEAEVMARHSTSEYRVHCLGFSPGFPYLGGLDPVLRTPRLESPRARVPAGSVAIGGEQTGIYPVDGPGGWNLIGWTPEHLVRPWEASTAAAFPVGAGDRVRFRSIQRSEADAFPSVSPPPGEAMAVPGASPCLRLLAGGLGITIQDAGRPGYRRFGVPSGGAMDPRAAAWANRLVGNPVGTPVLELCLQGQRLEAMESGWVAITGSSPGPPGKAGGWSAFRVRSGEVLEFPPGADGLWTYLAIPGGVAAPRFFGSASQWPQAGMGKSLRPGEVLWRSPGGFFSPPTGIAARRTTTDAQAPAGPCPSVAVWPGPQWDWFSEEDRARFLSSVWRVSARSNRLGYRLEGPLLSPPPGSLISEAVLAGCIQVPPGGQPLVTMPDGPTLGGYPQLALVDPAHLPVAAQVRPGHVLRFFRAPGDPSRIPRWA